MHATCSRLSQHDFHLKHRPQICNNATLHQSAAFFVLYLIFTRLFQRRVDAMSAKRGRGTRTTAGNILRPDNLDVFKRSRSKMVDSENLLFLSLVHYPAAEFKSFFSTTNISKSKGRKGEKQGVINYNQLLPLITYAKRNRFQKTTVSLAMVILKLMLKNKKNS